MHLDEHVPVVGHITLDLTNIKLSGFRVNTMAFSLQV
jgi:hypothetical protein